MASVYLGIGSNIDRERCIAEGLNALEELFGELSLSSVYDTPAIGFDGQPFLNLVVLARVELPLDELARTLRQLEYKHGRPQNATRFSARRLDIDILTYDDLVGDFGAVTLPRQEILDNAFVLKPLAELAPAVLHPQTGLSYAALWDEFDQQAQPIRRVPFEWRGRRISEPD